MAAFILLTRVDFKAARTKKCYKTANHMLSPLPPEATDLLDITKE